MEIVEINPIEQKVIEMIASEKSNKVIARELNYSQRAIEYYINSVSKKLNVETRVGIVCKAYQIDILKLVRQEETKIKVKHEK